MNGALVHAQETHRTAVAEAERIAAAFPHEGGKFAISSAMAADYRTAVGRADEAKSFVDALERGANHASYLDGDAEPSVAAGDFGRAGAGMEEKSLADVFLEGKSFQEAMSGEYDPSKPFKVGYEGKSIFSLSGGQVTHNTLGQVQDSGIIEMARRKMHIRDLFPKSSTKASMIFGVRETGWVNNAKQIKERYAADGISPATGADTDVFGKAPRSKITLSPYMSPVAEVAHLLDAHKNILSDEPRLRMFLNTRMVEGVKFAEDYDLLHSVGDAQKITGLFNQPGIQEYDGLATDPYTLQVRRAITKSVLAEYEPNGIVLSPTMWEQVETERDDTGAFRVAISVAVGATKTVWRLKVVETTAMADENFLVANFGLATHLHDREAVSVRVSTENSDNFERGIITFRADERIALEVPRPEAVVVGTWTAPTVTP